MALSHLPFKSRRYTVGIKGVHLVCMDMCKCSRPHTFICLAIIPGSEYFSELCRSRALNHPKWR